MTRIKAVLFDFGGVLAEEGFRKGMSAIGHKYGVEGLFEIADTVIYETGYVTGKATELRFWDALRERTGIIAGDDELRAEILSRFRLRGKVMDNVEKLKGMGLTVGILSDQTNWLYEVDEKTPFLYRFHHVFNSYKLGKGKRDKTIFSDVCAALGVRPEEVIFIDDKAENVVKAREIGLKAIHFKDIGSFEGQLQSHLKEAQMVESTCESKVTGKTVRIRHAVEADTVYISESLKKHGLNMGEIRYEDFVVATEDGRLIAFGSIKPLDEGETITVYNLRKEAPIAELLVKHMLEKGAPL